MPSAYGRHVKYVCEGASEAELRSRNGILAFLSRLCEAIGMRPLDDPKVFEVEECVEKLGDPQEDEGGLSGLLVLSTSHIALHGWPLRKLLIVDVFSCRDFDPELPAAFLEEWFEPTEVRANDLSGSMACPDGVSGPVELGDSSVKAGHFAQARG